MMIRPSCYHGDFTIYGCKNDSANACTLFQANEYDLHASINQRGFLEASSTDPSHQEQLDTSQEVDQGSQFAVEVNKPCVVPLLINANDSFEILEQNSSCIGLKLCWAPTTPPKILQNLKGPHSNLDNSNDLQNQPFQIVPYLGLL
jgi:hypothetical protein